MIASFALSATPTRSISINMSNPIYLDYDDFVKMIQDLLPCLLKILQNRFNQEIVNETVRGLAPETQVGLSRCSVTIELCGGVRYIWVSADLCGHSVQGKLGTININASVMITPRSGVSVDGDECQGSRA